MADCRPATPSRGALKRLGGSHATKINVGGFAQCRDHAHGPFSCKPRLGDSGQRVHKYTPRPGPPRVSDWAVWGEKLDVVRVSTRGRNVRLRVTVPDGSYDKPVSI